MKKRVLSAAVIVLGLSALLTSERPDAGAEGSPVTMQDRVTPSEGRTTRSGVVGIFEGRTPCGPIANGFTGFPIQSCEKVKWELTLSRNPASGRPTTYRYRGTRTERAGTWRIQRDAGPENRWTIYHLTANDSGTSLSLLRVDDNVLLLLDPMLQVLVGDASWSYALNRTDKGLTGSDRGNGIPR